ncbi:MAG TPA: glycosyltransferase [Gemmatimonadales bacterium]|nr:glycosyltransferase [Gemmatimonadales bacterium]
MSGEGSGLHRVVVGERHTLDDYAAIAHLGAEVAELRAEAAAALPRLAGRTVWMVNSTAQGGGVAEMLPAVVGLLGDLGVRCEWVVIGTDEPAFFALTKRLHNLIHGVDGPAPDAAERALYERVNRENARQLAALMAPGDVLIVHDPQPLPLAAALRERLPLTAIWRCHIGLDQDTPATRAAWAFLAPYLDAYDHAVFSAPEYIPVQLAGRATVIPPGIDPLAPKNRELSLHATVGIMCNGGLVACPGPTVRGPFTALAQRLQPDGRFVPAGVSESIGLLTRPIVTQISRWDRLKGFLPLLRAFVTLKAALGDGDGAGAGGRDAVVRRRLDLVRLVLAGPEPGTVGDDPEALAVLEELRAAYLALDAAVQDEIAILSLPMVSVEENALLVNALQRASTLVVQNSLREGFGLTIAEAMWKRVPVLSSARACGPRQQVRDGLDGRLVADPEDVEELRRVMAEMLADGDRRRQWGQSAQRRVHERFLVFTQLRDWGRLLGRVPLRSP